MVCIEFESDALIALLVPCLAPLLSWVHFRSLLTMVAFLLIKAHQANTDLTFFVFPFLLCPEVLLQDSYIVRSS